MITSSITLGSIVFGDVEFEGWSFRDLIDWWGQTEDKLDVVERPQGHGAFDVTRSLRTSRAISFTGTFIGSAQADAEGAFDALSAVGAEGPVDMIVSTPAGASMRTVTVERVAPVDHHGRRYGRYSVDLIARDPRRYDVHAQSEVTGPTQQGQGLVWPAVWPLVWPGGGSAGRITLTNTGKAPSAPTFVLSGGFDTALISCLETGARIGLNRQVPVGSDVVIDTKTRRAMIDGQSDVSRWLQFREWELIPPGASRTYQFDATGVSPVVTDLRFNLNTNPRLNNSLTGWMAGAGVPPTASAQGAQLNAPSALGANFAFYYQQTEIATSPGQERSSSVVLEVPAGFPTVTVGVRTYAYGSNVAMGQSPNVTIAAGQAVTVEVPSTMAAPAGTTGVRTILHSIGAGSVPAGARILFRDALVEPARVPGGFFSGATPPAGDISYHWLGPEDGSQSVQRRTTIDAALEGQVRSAWW